MWRVAKLPSPLTKTLFIDEMLRQEEMMNKMLVTCGKVKEYEL